MAEVSKDTIYVDVDDEITSLIDKVESSKHKIVALVLPKRASVLQSTVNMRLLKRSADKGKKRVVLITSEAGLLPLAGAVGLHVARNLQSRPVIPPAPEKLADDVSTVDDSSDLEDAPLDASAPVGDLADSADNTETIELDNDDDGAAELASAATKDSLAKKATKKDKKLKIPDFDKFRLLLFAGAGLLVLLIIFLIFASKVLPKAKITISTDTSPVEASLVATTSGAAKALDADKTILPSINQDKKQTDSEKVPATGSKDIGAKATGTITVRNCDYPDAFTMSAGSKFSNETGKGFVSTSQATVPPFTGPASSCSLSGSNSGKVNIPVQAVDSGESYNVASGKYTVPSIPSSAKVDAIGSDMTGGTSQIAKVVSQQDIDSAKQKITAKNVNIVQDFYKSLRSQGLIVLDETATTSDPQITAVPALNQPGSETTVTQVITYSVLTVNKADLTKLLTDALNKKIDTKKQQLSPGDVTDKATIRVGDKKSKTDVTLNINKTTTAMPIMNINDLKKLIVGKKSGDIKDTLGARPGIKDVNVSFSPFWVNQVPKNLNKTTITIQQTKSDGSGN